MIIAILEDNKGFRASFDFIKCFPVIQIPIRLNLTKVVIKNKGDLSGVPNIEKVAFKFYKWLEDDKVALYREV